jgi:ribonuclease HI
MELVGKVYIDGASRGNPGPSGIGIVVLNEEGKVIREHYEFLGPSYTNNQAEYIALMRALEICSTIFPKGVLHVFSDSELLVNQLTGRYKVRSRNLKELFRSVRQRERSFSKVYYHHVSRELNKKADELANKAIDEALRSKASDNLFK